MGGSLHRLEVLLVGVILLLASGMGTALILLRPAPSSSLSAPRAITAPLGEPRSPTPALTALDGVRWLIALPAHVPQPAWALRGWRLWLALAGGVSLLLARRWAPQRWAILQWLRYPRRLVARRILASPGWYRQRSLLPRHRIRWPVLQLPQLTLTSSRHQWWSGLPRPARPALRLAWPQVTRHAQPRLAAAPQKAAPLWTAEDYALAVARAWNARHDSPALRSPILALDAASTRSGGQVLITLDAHEGDETALIDELERHNPGWSARWQGETLRVDVVASGNPGAGGPLLVPLLVHGRRSTLTRFVPLDSQHLGLYGAGSRAALHAILGSVLYTQPPDTLALTILDQGEVAPLYRHVAHLAQPPDEPAQALERLARTLQRGNSHAMRRLLLVVIEPDDGLLKELTSLVVRLRRSPATPLHLIVVQERLRSAGRDLYATLPAMITAGGQGPATLLPGLSAWPRSGSAQLLTRETRLTGRPIALDETAIAALLAPLRVQLPNLPPTRWDAGGVPSEHHHNPPPTPPLHTSAMAEQLRDSWTRTSAAPHLAVTAFDPERTGDPEPVSEAAHDWPAGPAPLREQELAALLEHVLTASSMTMGQSDQMGLSKHRLAELLPGARAHTRELAGTLMVWFDHAGVLVEPTRAGRLHHPRPLRTSDLAEIAALLRATPIPDAAAVAAAWAQSAEAGGVR